MPTALTYSWFMTLVFGGVITCVAVLSRVNRTYAMRGGFALMGWLVLTGALGASGLLSWDTVPPGPVIVFNVGLLLTFVVAFSRIGTRLAGECSFVALTAYQVLRIPIEGFLAHGATVELVPRQITWEGRNFDVVTGALALLMVFALWRHRDEEPGPKTRIALYAFNVVGLALLATVVVIALLSTPPLIEQSAQTFPWLVDLNTWIARSPWIFLPTFLVPGALFFHLVSLRKLRATRA